MRKASAYIVIALVGTAATIVHASASTKAIVASYLEIQAALAADKVDTIKPAAEAIAKEASAMGESGQVLAKSARAVAAARDLKAAREAFGPLSDAVIAAAKADGWKDVSGVKIGFCPMVDKSWIQKDGQVSNPYYGSKMLTCGELKDVKK